ncbi:hypothetical protein CLV56_2796 [Mumia flava]|uniref:Winged helix-turn-helix protein n=1 Tax=Mumia flava TaxID=1348852 RepID=A0A0B2BIM4_9ACTN|nr:crosslink repair DNA glycosylase YcaQ family protein [Mumia flava]PJJ58545.1 hypothetical protein CLV56_2796 [Mumia flava]
MTAARPLSAATARRVALAAQGFADPPHRKVTARTIDRAVARTGVLQIDSVNVLQRAHYLPLFSRVGPYDPDLLHTAAERSPRCLVEYWAHVAAYMPVDLWPVMRHRMDEYRRDGHAWSGGAGRPAVADDLLARVRDRGPVTSRDLEEATGARSKEHWGWNWSLTKRALEYLFLSGEIAVVRRNQAFERVFDVAERVVPARWWEAPALSEAEAGRALVRRAAASHGVATEAQLRDYFRMPVGQTRRAVAELVESGELVEVAVQGWSRPGYLAASARVPRRVRAEALLSPFDPLVWERSRTEGLFGFRYRIEIYVPASRRVHGYYVLPFLLDEALVARVDLKADRPGGRLLVKAAWGESGIDVDRVADRLADHLRALGGWLGLDDVVVEPLGDLSSALAAAVARS